MKTKMVSIRISEDTIEDIKNIAQKLNISYQAYIKLGIAKIVARDKKKYG